MESDEKKLILDLLAHHVWKARREGILVGVIYSLGTAFLLYAALSGDPLRFLAIVCNMTLITSLVIVWLKRISSKKDLSRLCELYAKENMLPASRSIYQYAAANVG